jgi:hypothetical protein
MANIQTGDFRLRVGTYNYQEMTAAYDWTALPRQTDQRLRWWRPNDPAGVVNYGDHTESFDGAFSQHGGIEFAWGIRQPTPLQTRYMKTNIFGGGIHAPALTVMTWDRGGGDRNGQWIVVNCQAHLRNPIDADAPTGWEGYDGLVIEFYDGSLALYGRQHSSAHSSAFA